LELLRAIANCLACHTCRRLPIPDTQLLMSILHKLLWIISQQWKTCHKCCKQ